MNSEENVMSRQLNNCIQKIRVWLSKVLEAIKQKQTVNKMSNILFCIFRYALLAGLSFIVIYPLFRMFSMALRPAEEVYDTSIIWIPKEFILSNFADAVNQMKYWTLLINTCKIDIIATLCLLISCSMVGYGFARYDFKLKKILFGLVVFTIIVPVQTIQIPLYIDFRRSDLFGIGKLAGLFTGSDVTVNLLGPWSIYLPAALGVGLRGGLFIFIFRQFFKNMPKDLESAAKIDGCGPYKTFLRVMLPNALPAFITVFILSFVWYWNDYVLSSIFLRLKCPTLTYQLSLIMITMLGATNNMNSANLSWVVTNAACIIVLAPLIVMFLFTQKLFIESMDRSGIKG